MTSPPPHAAASRRVHARWGRGELAVLGFTIASLLPFAVVCLRGGNGEFLLYLAGMGLGAVNELVEFLAVLTIPHTNVGGYENTGWNLVFNAIGAACAAALIATSGRMGSRP